MMGDGGPLFASSGAAEGLAMEMEITEMADVSDEEPEDAKAIYL